MADLEALGYGLYALVTGAVFAYVGWRLGRRRVAPSMQLPAIQFAVFWYALAAVRFVAAFQSLYAAYTLPPVDLVLTLFQLDILILTVLLWALADYLVFLLTGRSYVLPISILLAGSYLVLQYLVNDSGPYDVTSSFGAIGLSTVTVEATTELLAISLVAVRLVPELVGAVLYFALYFRSDNRIVRYRVGLVGSALLLWFVGSVAAVGEPYWAVFAARAIGLVAAGLVLVAFFPPPFVQRRWGIPPLPS